MEYIHSKDVLHADLNAVDAIICKDLADEDCAKWIDFGGSAIDDHEALVIFDELSYTFGASKTRSQQSDRHLRFWMHGI
jgi:hypothetical protein